MRSCASAGRGTVPLSAHRRHAAARRAGGRRTLPVEMFQRMEVGGMTPIIPAVAFGLAMVGVVVFVVLDRTVGVYRYLAGRD